MNTFSFLKTTSRFTLLIGTSALLTACVSSGSTPSAHSSNSGFDHMSRLDNALARAANTAYEQGNKGQSLAILEKIYKRNSNDAEATMNYAEGLREADYLDQANMVLTPFATDAGATSPVLAEYAALKLAMSDYMNAQKYANKAIEADSTNGAAYQYLGIALDAQEKYPEGEQAFRKGLEYWSGNPTAIMNNLALNLAAQSYFEEAFTILERAKSLSPYKIEIERNLRIVRALQQTEGGWVPKPKARPKPVATSPTKPKASVKEAAQDKASEAPEELKSEDKPVTTYDINASFKPSMTPALAPPAVEIKDLDAVEPAAGEPIEAAEDITEAADKDASKDPISLLNLTYND